MSVVLIDGCEDLSSWTTLNTPPTVQASRHGNGFRLPATGLICARHDLVTADQTDTITYGFAFRCANITTVQFAELRSDAGATTHNRIQLNSSGNVLVTRSGTTIVTGSGIALVTNTWYYIEVTVKLGDSPNGTVTIRVNGNIVGSGTGLDTKNAGTKTVYDSVTLFGVVSGVNYDIDDLYVTNDATPIGDVTVETLYPNGNGSVNDWLGSDGDSTDNYALVNEVPPDTATYVVSTTAGQQDLYAMTDLAAIAGSVRGVCHQAVAAKSDSGTRQLKLLNGGSTITASPARDLGTTFAGVHWCQTLNPDTGAAYTLAEVNALQSGVEVV